MKKQLLKNWVLLTILVSGTLFATEPDTETSRTQLTLDDMRTFTDVFNQVREHFVDETNDHELLNAAIRGMLTELDPHSAYMEAGEFRRMEDNSRGRYSGIGVEVLIRDRRIHVISVREDGAAAQAGVTAGDIITAIGGIDVRGRNLQAAMDSLRGEAGSIVDVTFLHEDGEVSTHSLERGFFNISSLYSNIIDEDFAHFRFTQFTANSADELLTSIREIQAGRQAPLEGIILDLRGNPGGVLKSAVTVADGFLDDGLIVYTSGRSPNQMEYTAKAGQWAGDVPLVVLVDRNSASASEVLAGALQDHGRALIIGEPTFGKGSVQSVLSLRNGGGLRLTTSRYYTPLGHSIQARGIQPDVLIPNVKVIEGSDDHRREADLEGHLGREEDATAMVTGSEVSAKDDYALYQALILLKGNRLLSGKNPVERP